MRTSTYLLALVLLIGIGLSAKAHEGIFFVKTVGNNADIYYMPDSDNPSYLRQLTFHSGIDNHPDVYINPLAPFDTVIVWSSDRDGNFELYMGTLPDLEATATRLTTNTYPDRHPHFSSNGTSIIYTAKYNTEPSIVCPKDQCSIPVSEPCGEFEGIRILSLNTLGIVDLDFRNMPILGGGTWPNLFSTWVGHPSFNADESKLLFSAALDEDGSDWEVYSVDFTAPNTLSNLTQVTLGTVYPENPNPISMSAGAKFMENDSKIIYSSTRTPLGNSQLFVIPAGSVAVPVSPVNQLTWHYGNDYVPEQLEDGDLLFTSDLGPNNICAPPDSGATNDLDIVVMQPDGSGRTNLTNNDLNNEMQLLGDEVSWFCGIKPNLSECTVFPKTWNICWFREVYRMATMPTYQPNFPHRELYPIFFNIVNNYLLQSDPAYHNALGAAMEMYDLPCDHNWQNVSSWWIIPSMFAKWNTNLPANPALDLPPNKSHVNNAPIIFEWTPGQQSETFGMEVDDDPGFASPIIQQSGLNQPQYIGSLPSGLYYWRASATNSSGTVWSTVWYFTADDPAGMMTMDNRAASGLGLTVQPNPFSDRTVLELSLPQATELTLAVYDATGRQVQELLHRTIAAGVHRLNFDAQQLPAGNYFCTLTTAEGQSQSQKLTVLKQ